MKKRLPPRFPSSALLSVVLLALQSPYAQAGTLYWDNNTTGMTGDPPTAGGGSGNANWSAGTNWWTGSAYQAWVDDNVADFRTAGGTSPRTVTIATTNVKADGVVFNSNNFGTGWLLQSSGGAVLTLNNFTPNLSFTNGSTFADPTISAALAGPLNFGGATGINSVGVRISGTNTGVTSTSINFTGGVGIVDLANTSALGPAGSTVTLTAGRIYLDVNSGGTYNNWPTTLAGGMFRARNANSTAGLSSYPGNFDVTGNATISVRPAANNGLACGGTVNLNSNTLTLTVGDSANNGLDLQNVVSGTGSITLDANVQDGITTGAGVAKLSADNTFSGSATVNKGTLGLNHVNALKNATLNTGTSGTVNSVNFLVAGNNTYHIGALAGSDPLAIGGNTISVGTKTTDTVFSADISGSGGKLTKVGANKLTLDAATTYTGATTISSGTLALGASGALPASSNVALAAGATLDVSALTTYTHGTSASLSASGTGTTPGTNAAEIKGGTTVDLGSRPVTLTYSPNTFSGDSDNPALFISSGSLTTNSPITVVNNGGTPLGVGTYALVSQASGSITGTPTLSGTVGGSGIAVGNSALIQVSGGNLELVVQSALASTTTITRSGSTTATSTYGDTLEFTVNVSPTLATGTVEIRDGGITGTLIATGTLSGGSAVITSSATSFTAGSHANIVALYLGDSSYQPSASADLSPAQTVNPKTLTVTGAVADSRYFDTTTNATLSGGSLVGVVSGDEATVALVPTGTFASAAPGTGISVTSTSTLTGAKASNYSLTQPTGLSADIYSFAVWTGSAADTFWNTTGNWNPALVPSGANVTADFSTLDVTADQTVNLDSSRTIGNLVFGDTDTVSAAGWTLANNTVAGNSLTLEGTTPTITVNTLETTKSVTISAVVAGSSGLTKSGPGTLSLTNTNTYSGSTTVNGGILNITADSRLGAVPASPTSGNIILSGGATLASTGANQSISTNRGIAIGAGGGTLSSQNGNLTYAGLITGSAPVALNATGTNGLLLQGQSAYTGDTTLTGSGSVFVLNGYTGTPGSVLTGPFGRGTVTFNGPTTRSTTGNDTALGNPVIFAANTTFLTVASEKTLTLEGPVTLSGGDRILHVSIGATVAGKSLTISSVIGNDGTARALTKNGSGLLVLSNANTYGGDTTTNDGYLTVANNGALSSGMLNINTGTERLQIANGVNLPNDIIINGGGTSFNGLIQNANAAPGENVTVSGDITITGSLFAGGTFATQGAGSTLTVSGAITSASTSVSTRTGTVILSGGGSYSAMSASGTTMIGADNGIATNATVSIGVSENGILDLAGNDQTLVGILKGPNSATIGNSSTTSDSTLTLTGTSAFAGVIQDVVGTGTQKVNLVMNGAAQTLTLSGLNTYTGTTTVSAGTLLVNGNQGTATGAVNVNGGTLGGIGTHGGALTIGAAGNVNPGPVGTTGPLTVGATTIDGTYACDVTASASDLLAVNGSLTLTGATLAINAVSPAASSYTIATYTGAAPAFTTVTGLPSGYSLDYATPGVIKLAKSGYDSWATANNVTQGENGDDDNDGVINLVEYALGLNPQVSSVPAGTFVGNLLTFVKGPEAKAAGDVTYTIETSTSLDLGSWSPAAATETADDISFNLPPNQPGGKLFARLRVVKP